MVKTPGPATNETADIQASRKGMKRQGNSKCVRHKAGNLPQVLKTGAQSANNG
ncbi:hypothetical protein [Agrobacterium sp. NPDC089420]|uniref:hypothetical protein n=1 Tax=Agrobacterium sp. NPDC089420 TaxID=3363918 RepID=UPI00384CD712